MTVETEGVSKGSLVRSKEQTYTPISQHEVFLQEVKTVSTHTPLNGKSIDFTLISVSFCPRYIQLHA